MTGKKLLDFSIWKSILARTEDSQQRTIFACELRKRLGSQVSLADYQLAPRQTNTHSRIIAYEYETRDFPRRDSQIEMELKTFDGSMSSLAVEKIRMFLFRDVFNVKLLIRLLFLGFVLNYVLVHTKILEFLCLHYFSKIIVGRISLRECVYGGYRTCPACMHTKIPRFT